MGDSKHYLMASAKDNRGPNPRFKISRQGRSKRKRPFRARLRCCTCTWTCIVCADDTIMRDVQVDVQGSENRIE